MKKPLGGMGGIKKIGGLGGGIGGLKGSIGGGPSKLLKKADTKDVGDAKKSAEKASETTKP